MEPLARRVNGRRISNLLDGTRCGPTANVLFVFGVTQLQRRSLFTRRDSKYCDTVSHEYPRDLLASFIQRRALSFLRYRAFYFN